MAGDLLHNPPGIDRPEPVLGPDQTYATIDAKISSIVLQRPLHAGWMAATAFAFALVCMLMLAITYLLLRAAHKRHNEPLRLLDFVRLVRINLMLVRPLEALLPPSVAHGLPVKAKHG